MENSINVDYITNGLVRSWEEQLKMEHGKALEVASAGLEFDDRYLTIEALKKQHPELPPQMWLEGVAVIKEEYTKDVPFLRWVDYDSTQIAKGKVAQMVESREITKYSFEELVSLLRPF
jgi:hypothetical protein